MVDDTISALAGALVADPPKAVDPGALRAADQGDLAEALRTRVADLPPTERRVRLAAAFKAIADATGEPVLAAPAPTPQRMDEPVLDHLRTRRRFTPARIGALAGVLLVALFGGLALGAVTEHDGATPAAAQATVPVLAPVASGDEPPPADFVAGQLPPDPADQADSMRDALAADPEALAGDDDPDPTDVDIDAAANENPSGANLSSATVAGYADEASLPGAPDPASGGVDGGSDGGESGPDRGDDVDGSGGEPALVDICTIEDAGEECAGVGGTVTLASVAAFEFFEDPALHTAWPTCTALGRDLERDEFVIQAYTTTVGSFTARYRVAGSDADFAEVSGDTPEIWGEALEEGTVGLASTCMVADRPAGHPGPVDIELDLRGTGPDDTGSDRFVGVIEVEEMPPPEPVPLRREGRPPVQVTPVNAATLRVTVPLKRDENAEVSLVPRNPDAAGDECENEEPVAQGSSAPVRNRGGISISDWVDQRFMVTAPERGHFSVCVDWRDDFDPPRNLERASVPVEITAVPAVEVILAGWERGLSHGIQPDTVSVTATQRGEPCGSARLTGDDLGYRADRDTAETMCELDTFPTHVGITTNAVFGDQDLTRLALVPVPDDCGPLDSCTKWYLPTVHDAGGRPAGIVVIGLRLTGAAEDGGPSIGAEQAEFADEPDDGGPRLAWEQVSVEPDPSAPATKAVVTWETDVPAEVTVEATPAGNHAACHRRTVPRTEPLTEGSVTIDGLCPGESYYVSFHLLGDDGAWTIYDSWNRRHVGHTGRLILRSKYVSMHLLGAEFDYRLEFTETLRGEQIDTGVIPERMWVEFPFDQGEGRGHGYRYLQYFDGRARFHLDCAAPSHFDRAESGIAVALRGGSFVPYDTEFLFSTYYPDRVGLLDGGYERRCPTAHNQFHQHGRRQCQAYVRTLHPVGRSHHITSMLAGEPAVFEGRVNMCGNPAHRFTVRLTVTLREVRTLRGGL